MYKTILKTLGMGILCLYTAFTYAQVTTIDYAGSSLGSACNVFSPSATVSGVSHSSLAGGVSFTSGSGIKLSTTPMASPKGGTAFIVNYNFFPGDEYTIAITAVGNTAISLKTAVVPNTNQFSTSGTSNCSPDGNVSNYALVGFGNGNFGLTTSTATYNVPAFTITGSSSVHFLIVWATGGQPSLSLDDMTISKIVISKKVTVVPTFTISPATFTIPCGSSSAQTFTVTNVNNTPGVTSYNWDLGSSSNGWLYNGNPAPQVISTSGNTLTLTSTNCVNALGNITVTAVTSGATYPANNSVATDVTIPAVTVDGFNDICTTGDYSISNLPCNASVTWSFIPAGAASLSTTTGTQTTVTKITAGKLILRANITSSCGNFQAGKFIHMEDPLPVLGISQTINCQSGGVIPPSQFSVYNDPGNTTYHWSYIKNSGSLVNLPYTTPNIAPKFGVGSYQLFVWGENACGESDEASTSFNVFYCPMFGRKLNVSPNPATSTLNIKLNGDNDQAKTGAIKSSMTMVELIDQTGNIILRKKLASGTTTLSLPVGHLRNDIYTLRVFDGNEWISEKVIIRH